MAGRTSATLQYNIKSLPTYFFNITKWFKAQKQMNESFTFYVTGFEDLMDEVSSCPMDEEYKGYNRYRMVTLFTKQS